MTFVQAQYSTKPNWAISKDRKVMLSDFQVGKDYLPGKEAFETGVFP